MKERLRPFLIDLNHLKKHFAVDSGMDPERGLILRFRPDDMKRALDVITNHYDIQGDERIARHMFALNHLLERAGPPDGYVPSHKLS
jgi:hypothetical protein